MTAREFLNGYRYDDRLITGDYFSQDAIAVAPGEKVGVVMLNLGGPSTIEDVEPFLYNLLMDPAVIDIPVPRPMRDWLCRRIASKRSARVGEEYKQIGGGSPINRLTQEQARALENRLNARFGPVTGASFRTYVAMRHWHPMPEEVARRMDEDGIDKVVLLPLHPHYSKTTTGSSLIYWKAIEEAGELSARPTSLVFEYAAHPLFVQALCDRIDEALQRFPRHDRDKVHLLFSARGTPQAEMTRRHDPYSNLVHATVKEVMDMRAEKEERPFHVAFQSTSGPSEWLTPATPRKVEELANDGVKSILVVPVSFVTDHIETTYELDIEGREEARALGIQGYEVTSGLNCHPLFIEALAESVAAQVHVPSLGSGDGAADERSVQHIRATPEKVHHFEGRFPA